jgi:hypothetical protein
MAKCGLCGDVDGDGILTVNDAKLQWDFETGNIPVSSLACPQYRMYAKGESDLAFNFVKNCYDGTLVPYTPYQVYKNKYLFDNVLSLIDSQQVSAFPENIKNSYGIYPDTKNYIESINLKLKETRKDNAGHIDCCCEDGPLYNNLIRKYSYLGRNRNNVPNALSECCKKCAEGSVTNENDPCFDWCGCCEKNNNISNTYNSNYNYNDKRKKPNILTDEWYVPGKIHAFSNMEIKDGQPLCFGKSSLWAATLGDVSEETGNNPGLHGWNVSNEKLYNMLGYPNPGRWVRFEYADETKGFVCRQYRGRINVESWKNYYKPGKEETYIINLDHFKPIFKNFYSCEECMNADVEETYNCDRVFSWCDFYSKNKESVDNMKCRQKCSGNIESTDPCFKFCECFSQQNKISKMKL